MADEEQKVDAPKAEEVPKGEGDAVAAEKEESVEQKETEKSVDKKQEAAAAKEEATAVKEETSDEVVEDKAAEANPNETETKTTVDIEDTREAAEYRRALRHGQMIPGLTQICHNLGFTTTGVNGALYLDPENEVILTKGGNFARIIDLKTLKSKYIEGLDGAGVGAIAVTQVRSFFFRLQGWLRIPKKFASPVKKQFDQTLPFSPYFHTTGQAVFRGWLYR